MATRVTEYLVVIDSDRGGAGAAKSGEEAAEEYLASKPESRRLSDILVKLGAAFNSRLAKAGVASIALLGSAACVGQEVKPRESEGSGEDKSGLLAGDVACTLEVQPGDNLFVISQDLANGNPASQEAIFRFLRKKHGDDVLSVGEEIGLTENICVDNPEVTTLIPEEDGQEPPFVKEG